MYASGEKSGSPHYQPGLHRPAGFNTVSVPSAYADTVIANAREAASLQKKYQFKLILNAVITPETLPGMDKLLAFCVENKAWISFSPQSINNWPRYELVTSPEYHAFIEKIIQLKKQGAPILGSLVLLSNSPETNPIRMLPNSGAAHPAGWLAGLSLPADGKSRR